MTQVVSASQLVDSRLGLHHFAHLRAVAEGVPIVEAAKRYLLVDHGHESTTAHREVVERARALARRRGDSRWRLIGLFLPNQSTSSRPPALPPSIDEWAEAEGLSDWSQDDLQALYAERFESMRDMASERRRVRTVRLRVLQLALLSELASTTVEPAKPSDRIDGWFPPELADQLRRYGFLLLGDLQIAISTGGTWWRPLRGFGPVKAKRLAQTVERLLGPPNRPAWVAVPIESPPIHLSGQHGLNRATATASIAADDDRTAIQAWIAARVASSHTAQQYEREAERFLLFCILERHKALSDATAEDCRAYLDFLSNIPATWISRRKAPRLAAGWAPFKGPLSVASQRLAITVVHALFDWLVAARYLASNPWTLVNRKLADDPSVVDLEFGSRAFTPSAWAALFAYLDKQPPSLSHDRLRWICTFVEATGLRSAELQRARRSDFHPLPSGWMLRVLGKGRRRRVVPIPHRAAEATRQYFAARGLDFDSAPPETPLLAALTDPIAPVTYRALHETFTRFVQRALKASGLSSDEQRRVERASMHWLRHTHATRAVEREVPPDVLQENLGHADPRTTARYYRAQIERRQREIERAFGGA